MKFSFDNTYKFPNTIEEIDGFSGKEFEEFLVHFFKFIKAGEITRTDDTGDRGIDITIKRENKEIIGIQAKRWKTNINSEQVAKMLEGKRHYHLDKLWIITTSDLTSQAINTALNDDIRILRRSDVEDMLSDLKENDATFRESNKITKQKQLPSKIDYNDTLKIELKQLRNKLAKENKIYPLYAVFTNETITDLIDKKPTTTQGLKSIKGLGETRIEKYGTVIIETILKFK